MSSNRSRKLRDESAENEDDASVPDIVSLFDSQRLVDRLFEFVFECDDKLSRDAFFGRATRGDPFRMLKIYIGTKMSPDLASSVFAIISQRGWISSLSNPTRVRSHIERAIEEIDVGHDPQDTIFLSADGLGNYYYMRGSSFHYIIECSVHRKMSRVVMSNLFGQCEGCLAVALGALSKSDERSGFVAFRSEACLRRARSRIESLRRELCADEHFITVRNSSPADAMRVADMLGVDDEGCIPLLLVQRAIRTCPTATGEVMTEILVRERSFLGWSDVMRDGANGDHVEFASTRASAFANLIVKRGILSVGRLHRRSRKTFDAPRIEDHPLHVKSRSTTVTSTSYPPRRSSPHTRSTTRSTSDAFSRSHLRRMQRGRESRQQAFPNTLRSSTASTQSRRSRGRRRDTERNERRWNASVGYDFFATRDSPLRGSLGAGLGAS